MINETKDVINEDGSVTRTTTTVITIPAQQIKMRQEMLQRQVTNLQAQLDKETATVEASQAKASKVENTQVEEVIK